MFGQSEEPSTSILQVRFQRCSASSKLLAIPCSAPLANPFYARLLIPNFEVNKIKTLNTQNVFLNYVVQDFYLDKVEGDMITSDVQLRKIQIKEKLFPSLPQ